MKITPDRLDALTELINIGVGQAAAMLNEMIEYHIRLQVPWVAILSREDLQEQLSKRLGEEKLSAVQLEFSNSLVGNAQLVFPKDSAVTLISVLTGEEPQSPDLDLFRIGTLTEVGNIVLNGVMGSMGNMLSNPMSYSVPTYIEDKLIFLLPFGDRSKTTVLLGETRFTVEELQVQGDIILFFNLGSFDILLSKLEDFC
ncbi:MAG: chemotaxis protein CheC [Prochloraceae cyanobacterium]|nr:chemotaxis protein CheC [Prochloraceae cyanobacterium]